MTTPQVNVNVDSTRFRNTLEKAYPGALASDNPLAPLYNKQTFGGNDLVEAQHVIPESVANRQENVDFFKNLRTETEKSPGGAYVFKLNDVQNGIFLPTSSAAAATGQQKGVYAAVKSIAPFDPLLSDGGYYFLKKEIVMNFVYEEWLSETDTEKANALARSVGENDHVFQWVIDRESEVVLICFALSSRMMQGPGRYGLFIKGRGLTFKVKYTRGVNEEGVHGLINVFDKLSLEIPDDLAMPREVIIQLIKEALYVLGISMTSTALVRVNIE